MFRYPPVHIMNYMLDIEQCVQQNYRDIPSCSQQPIHCELFATGQNWLFCPAKKRLFLRKARSEGEMCSKVDRNRAIVSSLLSIGKRKGGDYDKSGHIIRIMSFGTGRHDRSRLVNVFQAKQQLTWRDPFALAASAFWVSVPEVRCR